MTPQDSNCTNCKWWEEILLVESETERRGFCHRYPPILQPSEHRPNTDKRLFPVVPIVLCGEWERKSLPLVTRLFTK